MTKFRNSWFLFKSSMRVIFENKKLLVFPIVTFLGTCVIILFFLVPISLWPTGFHLNQPEHWKAVSQLFVTMKTTAGTAGGYHSESAVNPLGFALGAILYFISMFLTTFFNVAFFHEILFGLKGHPVSLGRGFSFAVSKLSSILLWSLFAGAIGFIIKMLEQRVDLIGRIILRFIGIAWSVASVFAIPVLITEPGRNPLAILRKSAETLKQTWGESLIGYVGVQFGGLLIMLLSFVCLGGAIALSVALNTFWIFAIALVFWLLGLMVFGYLSGVASQVYRCALYIYATEGQIPAPYNQEMLALAWKVKKS
ncbi:MAG TPA: DUF6159 family protein [Verrucomicrobiae bacterium]